MKSLNLKVIVEVRSLKALDTVYRRKTVTVTVTFPCNGNFRNFFENGFRFVVLYFL